MRLKTITGNKEELAALIDMSYSGLSHIVPKFYYNQPVKGQSGGKEYSLMAHHHRDFRNLLAASPRLSSTGVMKLLKSRQPDWDQIRDQWILSMKMFVKAHPYGVDEDIHAYALADLELLGRCISTVPSLLPRPEERPYFENGPDPSTYAQDLASFVDDMEHDLHVLFAETGITLDDECTNPWADALELARKSLSQHLLHQESVSSPFTIKNLLPHIQGIHHSNAPYFWRDILRALGHKDVKVLDGAGDGNRDVTSTFQGSQTLSQVKTSRSPISEETVRQFASTCRTYSVPRGYFVSTGRYVRDAQLGQWPQLSPEDKAEIRQNKDSTSYHDRLAEEVYQRERIAEVELVDGQALARYAQRCRIGSTFDGLVDEAYWSVLTIPGYRRRTPAYQPLLTTKPKDNISTITKTSTPDTELSETDDATYHA